LIHTQYKQELNINNDVINNIIHITFSTIKAIANLIALGQNNCAITLWRHLYEVECILTILIRYGDQAIDAYNKHNKFLQMEDDDEELLNEIAKHKDRISINKLAFKNYGWLLKIDDFINNYDKEKYQLNIKYGLQRFAGLDYKYGAYSEASKILHPTSVMFKIEPEKYYIINMENLYSSTINIVNIIYPFIANSGFLEELKLTNFKNSLDIDVDRINKNVEVIRRKFDSIYENIV
jgi:hypothetical protein